jgi:AcrR family transcriptional regulator
VNEVPAQRETTGRRSANHTRQRIVDAARELFAEHGYRSTSMRQVAARAGLTDPALYYYFRSKHDVLTALLTLPAGESRAPRVETAQHLVDHVCGLFEAYSDDALLVRILLRGQLDHDIDSLTVRTRRVARLRDSLVPALDQLYGRHAEARLYAIEYLFFGMLWDGVIVYGKDWPTVARQAVFRERTRRLFSLIVGNSPEPTASDSP